jgi:hypothetical protein
MKQYSHAWLAMKAVELLKSYSGKFNPTRNKHVKGLLEFMSYYPSTFIRGAWFPDEVIKDNIFDAHTWKYTLDTKNGKSVPYRPPSHNNCLSFVETRLRRKVKLEKSLSDLPNRCEALSQAIRDAILIRNRMESGDVITFNNSQIATLFLMLSHYVCDAHVPVHCDARDLNKPSRVHNDLEKFWDDEIMRYYGFSEELEQFDLDKDHNLQLKTMDPDEEKEYKESIIYKCDQILKDSGWENMDTEETKWQTFLGKTNNNPWDYMVSVCLVSFHMSLKLFPDPPPDGVDYQKSSFKIMETSPFREDVLKYSPYILADAINSVALIWLATWERYELLEKVAVSG